MGHIRIVCIGSEDQYYRAHDYIHRQENPEYYRDLDNGIDSVDAYLNWAPDDIFSADYVAFVTHKGEEFKNVSKEAFINNLDERYPFWVYDKDNRVFDARLIDDETKRNDIDLMALDKDEFIKLLNELPDGTMLQILDSHW